MASKTFQVFIGTVLVLAGSAGIVLTRMENSRLRQRLAAAQERQKYDTRTREENRQMQELVARAEADAGDGARAIQADLVRVRAEVGELERKARAAFAQGRDEAALDRAELADNRDPENGLTRLEHFKNQGQIMPAAAFQTFVWAALKGEDNTLAGLIAFDGEARAIAEAAVNELPEATRAQYSTPEKLAALFFAMVLTAQPAMHITAVTHQDAQHATVSVRGLTEKMQQVPLQRGASGWQIAVPPALAEKLGRWAVGNSAPAAKGQP